MPEVQGSWCVGPDWNSGLGGYSFYIKIFCKVWMCHRGIDGESSVRGCDPVPIVIDTASQPSIPEDLNLHEALLFFVKRRRVKVWPMLFRQIPAGCDKGCWQDFSVEVYLVELLSCHHLGVAVGVCEEFQGSSLVGLYKWQQYISVN
jgi:hypothetical protein